MQETFGIKTSNSKKQYIRRLTTKQTEGKKIPNWQQLWSCKSSGSKTSCPFPFNVFDYLLLLKTGFNHGSDTNGNTLSAIWLVVQILSAFYHQDKVKVAKQSLTCRNCIQSTLKWCMCTQKCRHYWLMVEQHCSLYTLLWACSPEKAQLEEQRTSSVSKHILRCHPFSLSCSNECS